MKYKYALIILFLYVLAFSSCEFKRSLEGEPVNIRADAARSSGYEEYGDFYLYSAYKDIPNIEDTTGSYIPPLALASNKVVVSNLKGKVILLTGNDTEWVANLDSNAVAMSAMCADPEQNIYLPANNEVIYSFSKKGDLRWKKHFPHPEDDFVVMSDLLALRDAVIVGSSRGLLAKIGFDGNIIWEKKYPIAVGRTFSADIHGNLIIPLTHKSYGMTDTLLMLSPEGKRKWAFRENNFRFMTYPVIADTIIYIGGVSGKSEGKKNYIIAVNKNSGEKIWEQETEAIPRFISASIENFLYVISYDLGLGKPITITSCYSPAGDKIWENYYQTTAYSPLLISDEYLAFSGRTSNTRGLYFLEKSGKYIKTVSLSNLPKIVMTPEVRPDGVIIFAGSRKLAIIRTDEIWINKIIPW